MVTVTQNGNYININLKTFKDQPGMEIGEECIITKNRFAEGKEMDKQGAYGPYKMWLCNAVYEDQEVSFILFNPQEHAEFAAAGGVGDRVKVTMTEERVKNKKGQTLLKERLHFTKVD